MKMVHLLRLISKKLNLILKQYKPKALVVIPYDNPTGQFLNQDILIESC